MTSNREGRANVEAFPLTALEVLACGTPLLAYRSGGIPELVGDCARLVPTGDIRGLATALDELMDDADERRRLSECGPERIAAEFSLDRMVAEMSSLYESVAAR
jgi:glycosyltransferase involved in cell wall biosynthesis